MATIYKEIHVPHPPDEVWSAIADFGAVHERVAPGFVVDCTLDGSDRVVTFATGAVARERLVGLDPARRRLVYTVVDGPLRSTHHQASVAVVPVEPGRSSVLTWTTDVLPDELGQVIEQMMDRGAAAIAAHMSGEVDRGGAGGSRPRLASVTFDCQDAERVARFWGAVLGRAVGADASSAMATLEGEPAWTFIRVPEEKTAKNRLHVDLAVPDLDEEADRLVGLGATRLGAFEEGGWQWVTLADVEGNEFDIALDG